MALQPQPHPVRTVLQPQPHTVRMVLQPQPPTEDGAVPSAPHCEDGAAASAPPCEDGAAASTPPPTDPCGLEAVEGSPLYVQSTRDRAILHHRLTPGVAGPAITLKTSIIARGVWLQRRPRIKTTMCTQRTCSCNKICVQPTPVPAVSHNIDRLNCDVGWTGLQPHKQDLWSLQFG